MDQRRRTRRALSQQTKRKIDRSIVRCGCAWRTTTCTSFLPEWTPLTDTQEFLSVGDMVYNGRQATRNTAIAKIGARSAFGDLEGNAIGLLYAQNALASNLSVAVLNNAASSLNLRTNEVYFNSAFARGGLMLASAYQSGQTGLTRQCWWHAFCGSRSPLEEGSVRAIASDPNDPAHSTARPTFGHSAPVAIAIECSHQMMQVLHEPRQRQ